MQEQMSAPQTHTGVCASHRPHHYFKLTHNSVLHLVLAKMCVCGFGLSRPFDLTIVRKNVPKPFGARSDGGIKTGSSFGKRQLPFLHTNQCAYIHAIDSTHIFLHCTAQFSSWQCE